MLKITWLVISLLATNALAAPVPKGKVIPPPPKPDETLFLLNVSTYGTVVTIDKDRVTLKPVPNKWDDVVLPGGGREKRLLPIDETPRAIFIHPVMANDGLADEASGAEGYRVKDLKVGDTVDLYYLDGPKDSRWLIAVAIHDRDKKGPPPPFRTHDDWDKIKWDRNRAREARIAAKEAAEKK